MTKSISPQTVGTTLCVVLLGGLIAGGIYMANDEKSDTRTTEITRPAIDPNDSTSVEIGANLERLEAFRIGLDRIDGATDPTPAAPDASQTPDRF
ncbi:hypothetical protein [Litorimonas sp. WD9-15]|uniref:hypothetical protein n=1 Tax=Litorimonas sp. WD9-15 TaxID=3418716 RepID=UPI003D00A110